MIRRTVIFRGQVQGVGFRYTVVECIGESGVTGTVRNLTDGSVEAIFEGDVEAIDATIGRVRARMARHIAGERASDGPASADLIDFSVRR